MGGFSSLVIKYKDAEELTFAEAKVFFITSRRCSHTSLSVVWLSGNQTLIILFFEFNLFFFL